MATFVTKPSVVASKYSRRLSSPMNGRCRPARNWRWISCLAATILCILVGICSFSPAFAGEDNRLPAKASAQVSAPGYGPELAVDNNESTLWVASLTPSGSNNKVWFQLDLGRVKQVARLHWLAALGTPYPASAPKKYQVIVSSDGVNWKTALDTTAEGANEPSGDVLLNTNARYVRLVTIQVNDGTGWALGLREIWVTEGRETSASSYQWRMRAVMSDGRIVLSWQPPNDSRIKQLRIYRSSAPTDPVGKTIAKLGSSAREFSDIVPNWTPYFYWVQAIDSDGKALGISTKAAAFAHPATPPSERVETFAFWYEPYKPTVDTDRSVRHIGNAAFVVGPGAGVAADLAKTGTGVLPYITLYQTADWTGTFRVNADFTTVLEKIAPIAFFRPTLRFPGSPPGYVPTVFCRPGNPEYNPQSIQYTTCPNSKVFRDMVLARVNKQIAGGVLGFFVDNGYVDDIAALSVCQSTNHAHYYGDNLTSADAFLGMLMEITCILKKLNPHGIVMVNGGVPGRAEFYGLKLGNVCDGQLWEGYLRSSYSTPKEHIADWRTVYRRSVELEKAWHATPPRRMFVLSYPWNREEAFFCFATAKLCDLPWSAGLGINDPYHKQFGGHFGTYPELVNLRLGSPTDVRQYGGEKLGEVYVRRFERGVVVVNPTKQAQKVTLSLTGRNQCRDIYAKKDLSGEMIVVAMPPESGRVYLYK